MEKLPIVDKDGNLKGLITIKDIEKQIKYPNSAKDSQGRLLCGAALGITANVLERCDALVEETEKKTTWHITTPNSNYQVKLLSNAGVVLKSGTKRDGEDYKIRVNNKVVTTVTLE